MVDKKTGGGPKALAEAKAALQHLARDHSRTPMQWSNSPNGGFSSTKPWMRVNDDYPVCNAKQQQGDKNSVLAYWKRLLILRKQYAELFVYGDFDLINKEDEKLFCFTKTWKGEKAFVALNFSGQELEFALPSEIRSDTTKILVDTVIDGKEGSLLPYEGRIYLV
jgi:oligo-1,6-glucosidase